MNRFKFILCLIGFINFTISSFAQQMITKPELSLDKLQLMNREISILEDENSKIIVKVKAKPDVGIIWLKGIEFQNGIIEFDVKGKDILQESFVGIAFHGINDSIYEAVYFRPFNFHAVDPIRKKHALQYIALPKYDWLYLRETFPDKYEASLSIPLDPNDWFHVKIIINGSTIKTYVNGESEPTFTIQSLQSSVSGRIGFWTGNNSEGHFTNLAITNF